MIRLRKYLTENLLLTFLIVGVKSVIPYKNILIGIISVLIGQPSIISKLLTVS